MVLFRAINLIIFCFTCRYNKVFADYPQCIDAISVRIYMCPYDGKSIPPEAAEITPGQYLGFSNNPLESWKTHTDPSVTRLMCCELENEFSIQEWSNNNFFFWSTTKRTDICNHPFVTVTDIGVDGQSVKVDYNGLFLNMQCNVTLHYAPFLLQERSELYIWEDYIPSSNISKKAVIGGQDLPQSQKPFYIGVTHYHPEGTLVKIIEDTTWLEGLSPKHKYPIYISAFGRAIKILHSDNMEAIKWVNVGAMTISQEAVEPQVFRCKFDLEYILTDEPRNYCPNQDKVEALVVTKQSDFSFVASYIDEYLRPNNGSSLPTNGLIIGQP